MCTGIEIAMLVGAGFAAVKTVQSGVQRKFDSQVEAHQMELDAANEEELANDRADLVRKAGSKTRASARAAYAAAGVDVNEGSPLRIDQEIAQDVEHDAWQEVLTGKSAARRMRSQADVTRRAGKNAQDQSIYGAAGSLLASGGQAYRGGWSSQPRPEQAAAPIYDRSIKVNQ